MFSILNEMRDKSQPKATGVVTTSIGTAAAIYVLVAVTGYLSFGDNVKGNIVGMCKLFLSHFSRTGANFLRKTFLLLRPRSAKPQSLSSSCSRIHFKYIPAAPRSTPSSNGVLAPAAARLMHERRHC